MSNPTSHNPVTLRIEQLLIHYQEFSEDKAAKLCCWQLEDDERPFLDEFFDTECSSYKKTPDFFIRFQSPFHKKSTYGKALVEELHQKVTAYKEETGADAVPFVWSPQQNSTENSSDFFLQNLVSFRKSLPDFEDNIVAYLCPSEVRSYKEMEDWLVDAMNASQPSALRLMFPDSARQPAFQRFSGEENEAVKVIKPELDVPQAMKEIASAAGGSDNPGVKFQHLFIDLSQAVGKGDMEKAQKFADKAMEVALSNNWVHLQVAVYLTLGTGWMTSKNLEKALKEFDNGKKLADLAVRQEDPMGFPLVLNALFFKGSALVGAKDWERAAGVYQEAVTVAAQAKDLLKEMEAWRMAGFCHERLGQWDMAFDCAGHAVDTGEKMEPAILEQSTLPFAGDALLRVNKIHYGDDYKRKETIEARMCALLGEHWKQKLPNSQN